MAFYLQWPASNGWVETPVWVPVSESNWSFEVDIKTPSTVSGDKTVIGQENSTASRCWKLFINNGNIGIIHNSNWSGRGFVVAPVSESTRYLVRGEFDGDEIRLYLNDVLSASASGRNLSTAAGRSHLSYIGRSGSSGSSVITDLALYRARFWDDSSQSSLSLDYTKQALNGSNDTVFTDIESGNDGTLVNFTTDNSQWVFFDDGGGSVDVTITLDSGAYSLSGTDAKILKDSFLPTETGDYIKEGQSLELLSQRSLHLSAGSYTKGGDNIPLIIDRFLSTESGGYVYAGQDVDLSYRQSLTFTLDTGSYTYQGTDQGILKNFLLPVEAGEYTYDASNVTLLADRGLPLQSGEYTKTGNSINFVYETNGITYTLSLEEGRYLKQGTPLRMLADRLLPVDTGTYLYEGTNSNLLYNRVVALGSGLYSSAGTDLGLKVNRRLQLLNGNYSLTGTPITLSYTGEVLALLEGYRLSYKQDSVNGCHYKQDAVNDCFYKQDILGIRYK